MAEGKLSHFSWGLTDRRNAGMPVSAAHFQANIPATAKAIAVTGFVPQLEADMPSRQGPRIAHFEENPSFRNLIFLNLRDPTVSKKCPQNN
jgi:hypothetical protein